MNTRRLSTLRGHQGFTMIELLIAVLIGAIFIALAAPSFTGSLRSACRASISTNMAQALAVARSEAIKRGIPVILQPNTAADTPVGNGRFDGGVWSVRTGDGSAAIAGVGATNGVAADVIDVFQACDSSSITVQDLGGGTPGVNQIVVSPRGLMTTPAVPFGLLVCGAVGETACTSVQVSILAKAQLVPTGP